MDWQTIFHRLYVIGGFGLGLAIVQRIIQAHSGQIHVTSQVEKGSMFQVELPLKPTSSSF